jgi:hypothetical protein
LSWAGLAGALVIAISLIPDLMSALATTSPRGRLIAVLAFVLGLGLLGQALGLAAGALLHARLPSVNAIQRSDRIAGAAVGACGVVVLLWLVLPALTSAPGWPAPQGSRSLRRSSRSPNRPSRCASWAGWLRGAVSRGVQPGRRTG